MHYHLHRYKSDLLPASDRSLCGRSAFCGDRLFCVSLASGRRNRNYGLYLQCCEVFCDLTADFLLDERSIKFNGKEEQRRSGLDRS